MAWKETFRSTLASSRRAARGVLRRIQEPPREPSVMTPPEHSMAAVEETPLFVGHTRFSVHQFGSRYFKATRDGSKGAGLTEDQYTDWLYSDERMQSRTQIFIDISLPQLALAAEGHRVVHYVSISPSLPEKHKKALEDASRHYDFLELNETEKPAGATAPPSLVRQAAQKHNITEASVGVYRLDDDDVLASNFFELMTPYVRSSHVGWWVSQGLGAAAIELDGDFVYTREFYYPKIAIGNLFVASYDHGELTKIQAPKHTIVDRTHPTIIDSREPAYLHIRHRGQDSTVDGEATPFYPEAITRIRSEGPADLDHLKTIFPVLSDRLRVSPGRDEEAMVVHPSPLSAEDPSEVFQWGKEGAVALAIKPAHGQRVSQRHLQVRFSTVQDETCQYSLAEEREFFRAGKCTSDELGYAAWVPNQMTGIGYVLAIEPPVGVRITNVRFHSTRKQPVQIQEIAMYPL